MNLRQSVLETILGRAPRPQPPADLRQRLRAEVKLCPPGFVPTSLVPARSAGGWLRRWGFLAAPAAVTVACAAVFTIQQAEINQIRQTLRVLLPPPAIPQPAHHHTAPATNQFHESTAPSADAEEEIARLKNQATQLGAEVNQLDLMRAENPKLRAQLAVATALPPELQADLAVMEQAKAKAQAIKCVNNLKQLGLSVRLWATDSGDLLPPDVRSMSNEISSLKVPICPADTNRQPAQSWPAFAPANSSYQYLGAAGQTAVRQPNRVLFICPIHGSVTLEDGSVQMGIAKTHPDWLVRSNGVLYLEGRPDPNPAGAAGPTPRAPQEAGSAPAPPRP